MAQIKKQAVKGAKNKRKVVHKKRDAKEEHIKKNGAYFNKGKKYRSGKFFSIKAGREIEYRSLYEYAFYKGMDSDTSVVRYIVEPMKIPYMDSTGLRRNYIPDVLVLYSTGAVELCEIKPSSAKKAVNVQLKARAAVAFLKDNRINAKYRFITEKEIFEKDGDYRKLLKEVK